MTAYELRMCRPYNRKLPPFADRCVAEKRARQKFEDRRNTGIYMGLDERSNMVLVGRPNGVVKVSCIKRSPTDQAKDPELLKSIRVLEMSRMSQARYPSMVASRTRSSAATTLAEKA